ncbi:MAG: filamentous hemagglutinin N-terminal domain-containing protein, partial [Verrucomicrobia bacterium]|nr:filamentous hemagglutinin N-terminal domain-containing protein [Verrucomicrobiota bacterium]
MPHSDSIPLFGAHSFREFAGTLATGIMLNMLLATSVNAGDILRGGAPANTARPQSSFGTNPAASIQARSDAKDALARTSQALNSVNAMQAAARAAAQANVKNLGVNPNNPAQQLPDVPNGLVPGGLQFVSATGASAPTQSAGGRGVQVTVRQTVQQALINWSKFNIGSNTTLKFDQSAGGADVGQWVAFNKVNDPTGQPSQILGSISAPGQVYVINQNGIIFGGSSQVNVHALVASSLPINDNLIARGLLNNPDAQFLFSALALPAGAKGTPAFTPPALPANAKQAANGELQNGDVTVQAGARLTAPTTAGNVGGRIVLVAPNVTNAGTISTPDGQTILAAGLQVGFDAHKSSDPSLRGLDTFVGAIVSPSSANPPYAGNVTNRGLIEAPRANVTMAGKSVNQLGVINSSTSVSLNGRIDLDASYNAVSNTAYDPVTLPDVPPFLFRSSGNVTLGQGSVTQILPEWSSTEKVVGTALALRSQINMRGATVHLAEQASVLAPSATVNLSAGKWDYTLSGVTQRSSFVYSGGQIYLDSGSMINVAGSTDISAPMSDNIVTVQLRGAELADRPLQRGGLLRGPSITVDLRKTGIYNGFAWVGTPLADLSGYVGLVQRSVGALTTEGGTVNLNAGGSVIMQKGSTIDVSGGFINYDGGLVKTTRVLYAGHIINIEDALPDKLYEGIYTGQFTSSHSRWGVTNTYQVPFMTGEHFEPAYVWGANGGRIGIQAPAMALDGTLLGNTVPGQRQRSNPPDTSTLELSFKSQQLVSPIYPFHSPTPPLITFEENGNPAPADAFTLDVSGNPLPLRADRQASVSLSPSLLTAAGFGHLKIENPDGDIIVPQGVALNAPISGSILFTAANISILGSVTAPGGSVSFTTYNISPTVVDALSRAATPLTPPPNTDRGNFTLGPLASLSTAGLLVDDRLSAPAPMSLPLVTTGGTVAINSYNTTLNEGSIIDVSGGVVMSTEGKRTYGNGGSITIKSGQDASIPSVIGGKLLLGATLKVFSGATGGSLAIQATRFQIGGALTGDNGLLLSPDFFNQGGFSSFTLTGLGEATDNPDEYLPGILIAPGTTIKPVVQSVLALTNVPGQNGITLVPLVKPDGLRPPVSLSFRSPGVKDLYTGLLVVRGDVMMSEGSKILADPLASVSFSGDTVTLLGKVITPGGSISITGANSFLSLDPNPPVALPTVYIGPRAFLSTAGTTVLIPDRWGNRTGSVLPGGSISLSGNIVAESGAVLDVSGTSGVLDLPPAYLNLNALLDGLATHQPLVPVSSGLTAPIYSSLGVPTTVDSNGGTIILKGGQELFVDAKLLGNAGGPTALGGTLIVSSGRFYPPASVQTPADINLVVTQSSPTIPRAGQNGIGRPVLDSTGTPLPGMGYFAADTFARGGFDSLALGGNVQFSGPVNINARRALAVGSGGVIFADDAVNLTAPYVALGTAFRVPFQAQQQDLQPFTQGGAPFYIPPTYGPGVLTVKADLIDIGNLSLQNIGRANLIADGGDIRGNGTFVIAGDLYLRAGQIYPTTAGNFTMVAFDGAAPGTITIAGSGNRQAPLSAAGTLSIYASVIQQGGVLRAPFGTINLGWDGSGTGPVDLVSGQSAPVTTQLNLTAGSITSVSGLGLLIPYGTNPTGNSWIDPTGLDITAGGLPIKGINLLAQSVTTAEGSVLDLRGGGDLYAYRWIQGTGGSMDVLASSSGFAVIPSYESNFSPFAPFNNTSVASALNGDPGYVNANLSVGDRVYLGASSGLAAGVYTLLPARYALLPGAFLVTPQSGTPIGTFSRPDGSSLVSGYRYNDLNGSRQVPSIYSRFEVASGSVVRARSEYADYFANSFLKEGALALGFNVPRLPMDAGHLIFQATTAMSLSGNVYAQGAAGGRGGLVDISSPLDILITGPGVSSGGGQLVLDATKLSSWGAESLLIGGVRKVGANGTTITVNTTNLTVDNPGAPLSGPEIILVATGSMTLTPGSQIMQTGSIAGAAETLLLGDASIPGSGDGTLLRVSADVSAQTIRSGVSASSVPNMIIGAGVQISGASLTLDSTYGTSLDPTAVLTGQAISLNSGQISLALDGSSPATAGLVLAGTALQSLQSAQSLSLLSYTSLDIYGFGQFSTQGSLALHAAEIRGFNNFGGVVTLSANDILIDNIAKGSVVGAVDAPSGFLSLNAGTIRIGSNTVKIDQYEGVILNATNGIFLSGTGGLNVQTALTANTPFITTTGAATQSLTSGGAMILQSPGGVGTPASAGLGASLTVTGSSVAANTNIYLQSGVLTLHATTGDVTVGGRLELGGTARELFDLVRYTNGGKVNLIADNGAVTLDGGSVVTVAAQSGGGNAGSILVSAANGAFTSLGTLQGAGGTGGLDGTFSLDAASLTSYATLNTILNTGVFNESRSIRIRTGNIVLSGIATAHNFDFSTDAGSITVTGTLDASGAQGGRIALAARDGLTLASGSILTVAGQNFDNAGKGGAVTLETRGNGGAVIDIKSGSTIDLSVTQAASLGQFTGTLHLRAPQNAAGTNLQINTINGTISNASSIVAEGYKIFTLNSAGGSTITAATRTSVQTNAQTFVDAIYGTANLGGLLPAAPLFNSAVLTVRPGAEIVNTLGNLTLGATVGTDDWNLSTFRFGPQNVPGVLTLRAAGNLFFANALSDGFTSSAYNSTLMTPSATLPLNAQSWSYRLVAGADFTAADFHRVLPLSSLGAGVGSLQLGRDGDTNISVPFGTNAQTSTAVAGHFQVIRTGSGDIDIATARDVQLLNAFATIYTAGTLISDPSLGGTFDVPILNASGGQTTLGAIQQSPAYPAQYTIGGGNVTINAQGDIAHLTQDITATLVADSSRELPMNWLYRRGYVDPTTGQFGIAKFGDVASTTWWVDFSNFFQSVGALGGGNVTMIAGGNVSNVDAVTPTNARMPGGTPNSNALVELGGGDVTVRAGKDIDGGVYYVERGQGILEAGGSIHTNSTRSPSLISIINAPPLQPETWLPTTLFVGKSSFDVNARGDVLLGPAANPFLLPGGYSNTFWYKTYFSTYGAASGVTASSLSGDVTLRQSATMPTLGIGSATPILQNWIENVLLFNPSTQTPSFYQPWLRLNESNVAAFKGVSALLPGTLKVTAFSGDINVVGNLTLSPSAQGTVDLIAGGAINGLQPNGVTTINSVQTTAWSASRINLSDASPAAVPGTASPYAYQILAGTTTSLANNSGNDFLAFVDNLFEETGSTQGSAAVIQNKQALHAPGPLHAGDVNPVHLYATTGDISGLTLFAGKAS